MGKRTFSTVVLIGTVAALVWFNCLSALYVIGALFCLAALWEFYRMVEFKHIVTFKKLAMFFAVLLLVWNHSAVSEWLKDGWYHGELRRVSFQFAHVNDSILMNERVMTALCALFIISVLGLIALKQTKLNSLATAAVTIFGFFYIPFLFSFLLRLVDSREGLLMAVYVVAVTKSTDIGAYLIGSLIGRHKMSPQTSPKKTWEGFFGGVAVALMVSTGFNLWVLPGWAWYHALILGLILPVACVVGDLAESVIKRDTEIKDSGTFIPGIGGALDLIDSILFTAPLFYFYMVLFKLL